MKTKLLCSLSCLLFSLASAQVGRFTVTPLEVTGTHAGNVFTVKTAIHLDTETGQAYFLSPLGTNATTWMPIGFGYAPAPAKDPTLLRLATNATTGKITLEVETNTPPRTIR